jgi:protein ImuA
MGGAEPQPRLQHLRHLLAGVDPSLGPCLHEQERGLRLGAGAGALDAVLGGHLACGALHELSPGASIHRPAAIGFAAALAVSASRGQREGQVLWIATDFALTEAGYPYGPGLDLFGLPAARLLILRVPKPVDALWAMEEALRCRALAAVITELADDGAAADLTATRRLVLAARDGAGLGLLLRHRTLLSPSAAMTRWRIAAAPSQPDAYGGLGRTVFDLSLVKNRRGPCGRWLMTWDHHDHAFHAAIPLGVAETAPDRPDRAAFARTG